MVKRKAIRQTIKGSSKYDENIHVPGTPDEIAASLFTGRPKPKDAWRYLKTGKPTKKR